MRVSWQPLNLSEARGFVLFYTIAYTPILNTRIRQDNTMHVNASADESNHTIEGLDSGLEYSVVMSASTEAGQGTVSDATKVSLHKMDTGRNFFCVV